MNPELQRNLWIDATPRRLIGAGVGVAAVFAFVWLLDRGRHAYAVTSAGALAFLIAGLLWAPRAARGSVTGEVRAGTWDFQRLSALSPLEMTWGKLAGATVRPWVFAGGGLAIAALQLASTSTLRHAGFWVLVALALGATLQACGLATGLLDIRRSRASGRPLSGRAPGLLVLVLALLAVGALVWLRARVGAAAMHAPGLGLSALGAPVGWFGRAVPLLPFAALSLLAFAVWAFVWAWRLMRLELQMANAPWPWAVFVLGLGVYVLGFDPSVDLTAGEALAVRLANAGLAFAGLAYVAAFAEPADRIRARRFAAALRVRDLTAALLRLPIVVLPSALAVSAALAVAAMRGRLGDGTEALLALALAAFFVRDLGVIAWRRFATVGAPGDFGVAAGLLALYLLGGAIGQTLGEERGHALFAASAVHPRLSLLAAGLEALLAWGLAAARIARPTRPRWRSPPTPTPTQPSVPLSD